MHLATGLQYEIMVYLLINHADMIITTITTANRKMIIPAAIPPALLALLWPPTEVEFVSMVGFVTGGSVELAVQTLTDTVQQCMIIIHKN